MDWILTLSIISGQLIKIPFGLGGITPLDLAVVFLLLINIRKLNIKTIPFFIKVGIVFAAICTLSLILTPLHLTPPEYLNSFLYTLRFGLYLFVGLLVFKNPLRMLQISGVALAILGLFQFIFLPDLRFLEAFGWDPHYYRTVSTFLDPNFLGAYLVLVLIAVTQNIKGKSWLIFSLLYIILMTTFSRSSYLMFLVSFTTLSFLTHSKKLFILSTSLFLGLMLGFYIYTQLVTIPHGVDRNASASYRLGTWQQGLTVFEKSPILGVGFNSYRYAIREYGLGNIQFLNARGSTTNDFSLLYVLATTGILGLISYLFFIGSIFSKKSIISTCFLAGLLVHSIFNNSLFYPPILIWIIILAAQKK